MAATLLAAAAVSAAAKPEMTYFWDIQPSEQWTGPHELAKGDGLVELAILPRGLIEITEDVPGLAGATLLKRGDKLDRLSAGNGSVYCTVDGQPKIGNEGRFTARVLVCLVDANADGTFEGYFRKGGAAGIPIVFGSVPDELKPLGPVHYEARPPSALAGTYSMLVKLDSDPAKGKPLLFVYSAGGADSALPLSVTTKVPNGPFPQRFEVLGGYFELTGVNGGKAVIRMISPPMLYPYTLEPGSVRT